MKKNMKANQMIVIQFLELHELENDLLKLPQRKNTKQPARNTIYFDSLSSFRNFMTIQKLEILALIGGAHPRSIYELAKTLDRSIAPVQKDCQGLEAAGFITFERESGGRKTLTPKLVFPYHSILVQLPNYPYELQFSAA